MWMDDIRIGLIERDDKQRRNEIFSDNYKKLLQRYFTIKEQNETLLNASNDSNGADNSLQTALIHSLQSQLHSTRDELANLYKSQNQFNIKLLHMNELLRERDDSLRVLEAENISLKASVSRLSKAREDDFEGKRERERGIEALQDELSTLKLELQQVELRNQHLKDDNASLLQRWLDRMNDEAHQMNQLNDTNNAGAHSDLSTDDDFTDIDK
ncbi:hypothetical protein E3P99_03976 [Wallemia hederae]|uniref:Autophagy-related protein 16 domain-containing protein n=1 Tax=Wallemia hederae TaxID=1540922 RepID=A0A4T0FEI0_9BASI|nr:hypothetical protein E3P99_03976 [Wallemia hederae]